MFPGALPCEMPRAIGWGRGRKTWPMLAVAQQKKGNEEGKELAPRRTADSG